jgi:hypothetical protein
MARPTMNDVAHSTCTDETERRLFKAVMRQIGGTWAEIYDRPEDFRSAESGVGGFIYYSETTKFATRHLKDIILVLFRYDLPYKILQEKAQDETDFLNWLSWWALEMNVDKIMIYKEGR